MERSLPGPPDGPPVRPAQVVSTLLECGRLSVTLDAGGSTHALTASLPARDGHALGHLWDGDRRLCPAAVDLQAGLLYRVLRRFGCPAPGLVVEPAPAPRFLLRAVDAPWATVALTAAEFAPLLYSGRFELLLTDADDGRLADGPR